VCTVLYHSPCLPRDWLPRRFEIQTLCPWPATDGEEALTAAPLASAPAPAGEYLRDSPQEEPASVCPCRPQGGVPRVCPPGTKRG